MAKVKIAPQATGAGTTTLQAGTSASDYTLTLPDITDTIVTKTSTDTLTNKTLTTPTIDGGACSTGTWTPTLTAFGGTGTAASGTYIKIGRIVYFSVAITGTNVTSTANTSNFNTPVGLTPSVRGNCTACDFNTVGFGVGLISTAGAVYPATWSATSAGIQVTGTYVTAS